MADTPLKAEKDFSRDVDTLLPQAEQLAKVASLLYLNGYI